MSTQSQVQKTLKWLRDMGWMGEAGLGVLVAAAVGLALLLKGPSGTVWGVPLHILYAGATGTGAFMLTAALRLIPSANESGP